MHEPKPTPRPGPRPGPSPRPARPLPDVIEIYRCTPDDARRRFRWIRRDAYGEITDRSDGNFQHKAQVWRSIRRTQPDWSTCRIDDRTRTWEDEKGGTNLSRPPGPPEEPPARKMPSIREAQRRL